jgi:hypothetical protein
MEYTLTLPDGADRINQTLMQSGFCRIFVVSFLQSSPLLSSVVNQLTARNTMRKWRNWQTHQLEGL